MKTCMIILAIIVAVFLFLAMIPMCVKSQQMSGVSASGTCTDFVVTVTAGDIGESCWDLKLDVPGKVNSAGTWRSSYYYIEKAICWPHEKVNISIRLESSEPVIEATAKMRQGSVVLERDFTIIQSCPEPLPDYWVILVSVIIILVFGWSLAWWWKRK